ncbi:NAD-dependent epimerase/dehydratase family protein [bacterium]|nr:NAD-dependent epimerase/dehydratase family protein [bacterium]
MERILLTGGSGFVGSSLALLLKNHFPQSSIICFDNLHRRGSELNVSRLRGQGIEFIHGDIRHMEDLHTAGPVDAVIDCSAEPSVLAGYDSSPRYAIDTNLVGTINVLEYARENRAALVFLSTSRVYPIESLSKLDYVESDTRFDLKANQPIHGASGKGIKEGFPMDGPRSLYGATKYASELLIQEYIAMYGMQAVINRCGVLTGPWQFGKVDQGFVVLWVARHYWNKPLAYIGFGGEGKQVRDILHVEDLFALLDRQLASMDTYTGQVYNVGGGAERSVSLQELTLLCEEITGNRITIERRPATREADIPIYISDNTKIETASGWTPKKSVKQIVVEIHEWIQQNEKVLKGVLL